MGHCTKASIWLTLLAVFSGCDCGGGVDPCAGVDCSAHGTCHALPAEPGAYCACDPGFHPAGAGLECVADDASDPCWDVDCGGHGWCGFEPGGEPYCVCWPGWHVDESRLWCLRDDEPPPVDGGSDAEVEGGSDGDAGDGWVEYPVHSSTWTYLDLLVVIDDSDSMGDEQESLAAVGSDLIRELLVPRDADGDGTPDAAVVENLNLGIISTDMGSLGFALPGCAEPDAGDDGCFISESAFVPPPSGCSAAYPAFLSWWGGGSAPSIDDVVRDFGCLAVLGTAGCSVEQPLEAVVRGLTDRTATGGCNQEFLRPDSLLAVVVFTDDDDCSVDPAHPEMLDPGRTDLGSVDLRCALRPEGLIPVAAILERLRSIRADNGRATVLGMIVGVPPDEPRCLGDGSLLGDCLDVPAMQARADETDPTRPASSCETERGAAHPPRRLVEVAQEWWKIGGSFVKSICVADLGRTVLETVQWIHGRLSDAFVCLPEEPAFDMRTCRVNCFLVETLSDARECDSTEWCPAAWCPPATVATLFTAEPCRDPSTGEICDPPKRDLGLAGPSGFERRLCLIRQADPVMWEPECRVFESMGWYYLGPDVSPHGCPEFLMLTGGDEAALDPGSLAVLRCWR